MSTTYATLSELKARLGISGSTQDDYLQLLLDQAADLIDGATNSTFSQQTATDEPYDGTGTRRFRLRHRPVIAVSAVKLGDDTIDSGAYEVTPEGWVVLPEQDDVEDYNARLRSSGSYWPPGTNIIKVTYDYGYAAVPPIIKGSCLDLAYIEYKRGSNQHIKAESFGPRSVTYVDIQGAIPPHIMARLQRYVQAEVMG